MRRTGPRGHDSGPGSLAAATRDRHRLLAHIAGHPLVDVHNEMRRPSREIRLDAPDLCCAADAPVTVRVLATRVCSRAVGRAIWIRARHHQKRGAAEHLPGTQRLAVQDTVQELDASVPAVGLVAVLATDDRAALHSRGGDRLGTNLEPADVTPLAGHGQLDHPTPVWVALLERR